MFSTKLLIKRFFGHVRQDTIASTNVDHKHRTRGCITVSEIHSLDWVPTTLDAQQIRVFSAIHIYDKPDVQGF